MPEPVWLLPVFEMPAELRFVLPTSVPGADALLFVPNVPGVDVLRLLLPSAVW